MGFDSGYDFRVRVSSNGQLGKVKAFFLFLLSQLCQIGLCALTSDSSPFRLCFLQSILTGPRQLSVWRHHQVAAVAVAISLQRRALSTGESISLLWSCLFRGTLHLSDSEEGEEERKPRAAIASEQIA